MTFDHFSLLPELSGTEALIAGVDEVGRGALFGPVVAAAIVFPLSVLPQLLEMEVRDSKQLSAKRRLELTKEMQQLASAQAIGFATVEEIDRINILQASLLAMKRAVINLEVMPEMCLVDGRQAIPDLAIAQKTLIMGDIRSPFIGAASIIAKVWRDELIVRIASDYPEYDLATNKGYGTAKHRLALQKYGVLPGHRRSFSPCREAINFVSGT
jgi:ribonuclease HII